MSKKVPINWFVGQLEAALNRGDGYIMGSTGQNPKKWATDSWWFTQYSGSQKTKALYWREHASRVWDCNGMAEGLYKDYTGIDINTYARVNFQTWCAEHHGWGTIPASERKAGMAVFKANSKGSWSTIHHVGYLYKPVKAADPTGDWYIIEAKGVMYGVVKTKLSASNWNAWGRMDKYFEYDSKASAQTPAGSVNVSDEPELMKGDTGEEVRRLQEYLLKWREDCLPVYGADGDFGSETYNAVVAFQADAGLTQTGIVSAAVWAKLKKVGLESETLTVTGGSVYLRKGAGKSYEVVGVAHKGTRLMFDKTELVDGTIWYHTDMGWLSGKYATEASE